MSDKMINDQAMGLLFREARTRNGWQDRNVSRPLMQAIYDLMKWGATSANCSPARFVFVASDDAKARLKPLLSGNNAEKTMKAPCCVIVAHDGEFYEKLPQLFPHTDARSWFAGNEKLAADTAFRNGTLQGAYFMLAARGLGLDCGPMSGFDNAGVDREFLGGTTWKSNFLCNIGYGTDENLFPRSPRLAFDDACKIV
jgi:3-hydroxypropanoate dehydrogenase